MSNEKPDEHEQEIQVELDVLLAPDHPLQGVFGVWKDQPERVERMMGAVARYRRKIAQEEARAARIGK